LVPYSGKGIYEFKKHENAFLIIPSWRQLISEDNGLYLAPVGGVPGYPSVSYCYECSVGKYPEQNYYVRITTEDCFGARNTKTFTYRLLPTGCY